MQTRSSDENYVSPSVCLFVKRVHCDKTEDFFILYERLIIYPSFLRRRMVGGGAIPSTLYFGSTGRR